MIRIYSGTRCVEVGSSQYNLYELLDDRWKVIAPCNYPAAVDFLNGMESYELFTISVFPFPGTLAYAERFAA